MLRTTENWKKYFSLSFINSEAIEEETNPGAKSDILRLEVVTFNSIINLDLATGFPNAKNVPPSTQLFIILKPTDDDQMCENWEPKILMDGRN